MKVASGLTLGVGVALVALTVGALVVTAGDGTEGSITRLDVRDAEPAEARVDYDVEHRLRERLASRVDAMLPNGDLVLFGNDIQIRDPSGRLLRTAEEIKPRQRSASMAVLPDGDVWVWWETYDGGDPNDPGNTTLQGVRYDPRTGERAEVTAPRRVPQAEYPPVDTLLPAPDGRLYFTTGRSFVGDGEGGTSASTLELWSADPDDPSSASRVASRLSRFALVGPVVVWLEPTGSSRPDRHQPREFRDTELHVRDPETEEESVITLERCDGLDLVSSGALVAVVCSDGGPRSVVVLDMEATPLAELGGGELHTLGVTEHWVVVNGAAYDVAEDRLVRLTGRNPAPEETDLDWEPAPVAIAGDRVLFPSDRDGGWAYARLLDPSGDGS